MKNFNTPLCDISEQLSQLSSEAENSHFPDPVPPSNSNDVNKKLRIKSKKLNLKFKKKLVRFVLKRTREWIWGMGVIFLVTGISNLCQKNPFLSDSVLIALIGGTSLVGLVAIILKSLFKGRK